MAAVPTTRSFGPHPRTVSSSGSLAAVRHEALADGSAACDLGTLGSVRWCGQAKGIAAVWCRMSPCSRQQ
ncbi:hypothetical protein BDA96_05G136900 [Sorghum bicolor]|nr:hypothetical protein BDA96_05G136900 [Sorghum bicolor]